MNGSAGNQQQVGGQQPLPVPQNGPVMYGSGIVFGGNVYPVLIDGVPIQPPAGAHQAAVQQRMQMQQPAGDHQQSAVHPHMPMQQRLQGPHHQQTFPKPLPPQRANQRGPPYGAKPTLPQIPGAFGRVPGGTPPSMTQLQQPMYSNQQQPQQQQLAAMGSSSGSVNFNYAQQPSAGGDFHGNWDGYAMWQPSGDWSPF